MSELVVELGPQELLGPEPAASERSGGRGADAAEGEGNDSAGVSGESSSGEGGAGEAEDEEFIESLLAIVQDICRPEAENAYKRRCLVRLSVALRPQELPEAARRTFIQRAMAQGVVDAAVKLIELGVTDLACAAANFLGDFAFNSDAGARAVLQAFERIAKCFKHIFQDLTWHNVPLLDAAILLCVNIAATCPSGHPRLVPLVRPVCVQIIKHPSVSDKLRGNTILLLANLSMTVGPELRQLRVGSVLLDLVLESRTSGPGKSVAESVIIFLHGHEKCEEIDALMSMNVIRDYCVPIMERTLAGAEFRGMYPHLLYSARLLQVLARSRPYAEALVANPAVVPLLLRVNHSEGRHLRVESDLEGRRLALEALWSLARFGLWPAARGAEEAGGADFLERELPALLQDPHPGIRASAAGLWACVNARLVLVQLCVGQRLEGGGQLPAGLWRMRVLSFLFPFLENTL